MRSTQLGPELSRFKQELRQAGFDRKSLLTDDQMAKLQKLLASNAGTTDTSAEEIRYIEGLVRLPFGHLPFFRVIPGDGAVCACGRRTTALDLVAHALNRQVHDRELVRETLLGLANTFE